MTYRELAVPGAFEITPQQHRDPRGLFLEAFTAGPFADAVGHAFDLQQANCSVSAAGVLRGIHFADVPPSQAKYVMCVSGAVLDVVVDLRVGSPTFGRWLGVVLDDRDCRALYIAEGLGHAVLALTEEATIYYLCSEPFSPGREHAIDPLDPRIGIDWPEDARPPGGFLLSDRDARAPGLDEALAAGLLPSYDSCLALDADLRARVG